MPREPGAERALGLPRVTVVVPSPYMPLPRLDLSGTKGVGRRKLDAVPDAFALAFDPASAADERERAGACESIRLTVSGEEGAFTTAGARVLAAAIDALLGGEVARPELLGELAIDLAYGDRPVDLAPLPVAAKSSPAAKAVRGAVTDRLDALRTGLRASLAEARGLSAWLLLHADAVDERVVQALATERDPGVRAALLGALAGLPGVDRGLLRASMSPPAPPSEQAAAAVTWWILDGDEAPDGAARVILASRNDERPGPGYPWRASAGRLGLRRVLASETSSRALVVEWMLQDIERALETPSPGKKITSRGFSELGQVLRALLPRPLPAAEALSPLARRAVLATTARWFIGRRDYADLGLPDRAAERRVWLGVVPVHDPGDPLTPLRRWVATKEDSDGSDAPSEEDARAALDATPPASRTAWAEEYLASRRRWPDATSAPNRAPTLLALEQLAPRALDSIWCRDHEPVLAALSDRSERAVALFGRIPIGRRPHVWRTWTAMHPNPNVAFEEGLRFAVACPTSDVACGLIGLAAVVMKVDLLAQLAGVLDAMGDAGRAARERLDAMTRAATR